MSRIEKTLVKCDAKLCDRRTYIVGGGEPSDFKRRLNTKQWAWVGLPETKDERTLCPEHARAVEDLLSVVVVPRPTGVFTNSTVGSRWSWTNTMALATTMGVALQ
jgi:hypothetical protein